MLTERVELPDRDDGGYLALALDYGQWRTRGGRLIESGRRYWIAGRRYLMRREDARWTATPCDGDGDAAAAAEDGGQ